MSNRKNLANGILADPVNDTTTTWTLESGYGAGMPPVPFYITATPFGQLPTQGNSEIVNVTARSGDTLTVTRGAKGTTAKAFDAGAVVANAIYDDEKWTSENIDFTTLAFGNYSTSEVDTGFTWIDGKKIYKKTINLGALPNSTVKNVAHGIAGFASLVRYVGHGSSGATQYTFPQRFGISMYSGGTLYMRVDATNVTLVSDQDFSGHTGYVTLEYTKS